MWTDHCLSMKHKLGQLGEISVCCYAHLFPFTETNECQLISLFFISRAISILHCTDWLTGNAGYARQWQQIERQWPLRKPLTEWARFWCILALICLQNVSHAHWLCSPLQHGIQLLETRFNTPFLISYTSILSLSLTHRHAHINTDTNIFSWPHIMHTIEQEVLWCGFSNSQGPKRAFSNPIQFKCQWLLLVC